jgi:hypothetical protein
VTPPVYGGQDGHGRYGILDHDEQGRVLCHECGGTFEHLATHARGMHGILAADYRRRHGLSSGTALVGDSTRNAMRQAWERNAEQHTADLAARRNTDTARAAMTNRGQWASELVADRIARARARRVDLNKEQIEELGDWVDIPGWAARARTLMQRDGVPAAAIARALDVPTATVWQRLRRHPRST